MKNSRDKFHPRPSEQNTSSGHFFPTAAEYTFFSVVLATPSKTNHTVHHKTSLNKCKRIYREILLNVFSIFKMQSSHLFSKMSHLKDRATKHVSR